MIDCKVCKRKGMIPKCPFCGRKPIHGKRKSKIQMIKDAAAKERARLNQIAFNNFKKTNSDGSGFEPFDEEIKRTIGDWK